MLDATGEARMELFVGDGVHLSRAGYDVWTSAIKREIGDWS